ncbi:MAG: MarR family transcriptional regulator [Lachnospiraceae bacterium]|nr:MarR family transcriptional regulator [Lachnospiraceae bacterium]
MKKILEQYFGNEVKTKKCNKKLSLPIFMTMRDIILVELYGVRFAIVDITTETEMTISTMKKQKTKYEIALKCPVAYGVKLNSVALRNAMIKSGITFVDLDGNIFLPFIGIVLSDAYKKQIVKVDKMMPTTQMVFLELLYMNDDEAILKSDVANKLNLTKTTITRATAQLKEMGLINQVKSGKEIFISRNFSRKEYYKKAKDYLINPVQKLVTIKRVELNSEMCKAGETALSKLSQLNLPRIEEYAVYKGEEIVDQFEIVDERLLEGDNILKVELWKYNPMYFSKNGIADPVSIACTFKESKDERIEMSIEEMLEEL